LGAAEAVEPFGDRGFEILRDGPEDPCVIRASPRAVLEASYSALHLVDAKPWRTS
jgi:hypothetical protein